MNLDLENKKWKEFKLGNLFQIERGRRLIAKSRSDGKIPYYSASSTNNGLTDFIENPLFKRFNKIIVTTFCDAYYVEGEFTASDEITMMSNEYLNKYSGRFITRIIVSNQNKYAFGRKAFSERLEKQKIILPIDLNDNPDYKFMESYIRQKEQDNLSKYKLFIAKRLSQLRNFKEVESLDNIEWKEFLISHVTDIESGRDIYEKERAVGNTPYVSATANNNGIGYFVGNSNKTKEAGCLSVNRNGSVGYSFYHPYQALFSNDCRKLRLKNPSRHIGLFVSQQITLQKSKYGYGYKMGTARLKKQKIMLPVNQMNEPDYEYMENYMKKIEYQKLQRYLQFKNLADC